MKKLILSLLLTAGISATGYAQIFSQNFNSSSILADYISATPTTGQFNNIGTSNVNSSVSIVSNQLKLTRSTAVASVASFSRTTDISSPAASFLKITFNITVSGNTASATSAATFQVGTGFGTSNSTEANSVVNTRFFVNFTTADGQFTLRKLDGGTSNSSNLSGNQSLGLFINKTGTTQTYSAPDGSTESLANGSSDLWAGTTKIFDDFVALNAGVDITDFKFVYDGGSSNTGVGSIDIDNILINDQTTVLPVSLTAFTAKANAQNVNLAWATASEQNNSHFDVLRSADGKVFSKIDEVKGNGTTAIAQNYSFTDRNALPGTSYYQLRQVDQDGKTKFSESIAVKSNVAANNFSVTNNAQNGTVKLTIFAANEGKGTLKIYDLNGRKLAEKEVNLSKGYTTETLQLTTGTGLHIASLTTATEKLTQKFIR